MNKRPRTLEEMAALPIGPEFSRREIVYTDEDKRNGYIVVGGGRVTISADCHKMMMAVCPEIVAFPIEDNDIIGYTDADGVTWSLGRYATGAWFRQRHG